MFVLLKKKMYLIGSICLSILIGLIALYFYLTSMKTIQGSVNINKITSENRIYTYSVFSDFFYRATRYNSKGNVIAEFSEIVPSRVDIGFDFNKSEHVIRTNSHSPDRYILSDFNDKDILILDALRNFHSTFSEIVVSLDQHYFDMALSYLLMINENLLQGALPLPNQPLDISSFYEEKKNLFVGNLRFRPFKLDNINQNLKSPPHFALTEWSPNLIEYIFGEGDRIYLQYLDRVQGASIEDIVNEYVSGKKSDSNPITKILSELDKLAPEISAAISPRSRTNNSNQNKTVVKAFGINDNSPLTLYFFVEDVNDSSSNQITAFFMDENGYVYMLRYNAHNRSSFNKFLPDFLKVAFGLYFVDVQEFTNVYAIKQKYYESNLNDYIKNYRAILQADLQLHQRGLIEYFGLQMLEYSPLGPDGVEIFPLDKAFEHFRNHYGHYPHEDQLNEILEQREILLAASKNDIETHDTNFFGRPVRVKVEDACEILDFNCVVELSINDWKMK